jgi:hypothetical protein
MAGNAVQEQNLGEVPEDLMSERALRYPVISPAIREFAPGTSPLVGAPAQPYGVSPFKSAQYAFVASTASQKVIPANPYRVFVLIQNNDGSGNAIFVGFGGDATAISGLKVIDGGNISFSGGSQPHNFGTQPFCPTEDIYILGLAASACVVMEGIALPY